MRKHHNTVGWQEAVVQSLTLDILTPVNSGKSQDWSLTLEIPFTPCPDRVGFCLPEKMAARAGSELCHRVRKAAQTWL